MKVLHVIRSLGTGGAERVVLEYAARHDRAGVHPEIACIAGEGALAGSLVDIGVPVHVLNPKKTLSLKTVLSLSGLIRRGRFDLVHNHNAGPMRIGVPAAVLGGARAVVRTEHNVSIRKTLASRVLSRVAALREDGQIAVSEAVRRSHIEARRITPSRLVTIPNGIDDGRFAVPTDRTRIRSELGLDEDEIMCLAVGSLTPQKNYANLLAAVPGVLERCPRARFFIAGGGPLRAELEARARDLGLAAVVCFLGERLDVPRLLGAADVFVLASLWEGLPITVLEAMASRVPCVATAVGGTPEVLTDGVDGRLVPPDDPRALADAIGDLAADADLRERTAEQARRTYDRRFTAEGMARQTEAFYRLALAGRADAAAHQRIKVLYLIGQLTYGGAERQLLELVARLPRDVFDPVVCSFWDIGPIRREMQEAGVRLVTLRKRPGPFSRCSRSLLDLIREEKPVILHSYLFSANLRGLLAGRYARVPVIISSVRNVDIHSNRALLALDRALALLTDRVIANANAVGEYVSRCHGVDPRKIRVIYNGVSLDRMARGAGRGRGDGDGAGAATDGKTVGMLASLTRKKDHGTFLEAASLVRSECPEARFVAVGDGPLRAALVERASALGMDGSEIFVGQTSDAASFLSQIDVSVLTSIKEGCSNVVLESMAVGKPVVVTDVGGNPELVEDGVTGFVVPSRDPRAVARRIMELLRDPDMRSRMGEAGRQRVLESFTADRMVDETVAFYYELLSERIPGLVEWVKATAAREEAVGTRAPAGRREEVASR